MSLVPVEGKPIRDGWMYVGVPSSGDDFLKDIEEKQNPNFVNSYGLSALCMAVKAFQSPSLVEKLLKMNADPNFQSYIGRFLGTRVTEKPSGSPLHIAAWLRHPGITKILLDGGADPNTVAFSSLTPLLLVLSNTRRMGQRKEPFNEQAALDVMKLLIDNGADVTAVDNTKTDDTSLLHMATKGGHLLIVNYLLSLRALDVNCRNIHGETSLMIALREDEHELLEELLLHGADPNIRDVAGCTALHIAVGRTYVKSVEILIQNGADVNIKDNFCQTALHAVASRSNKSFSKSNVEVMKSLLSNNADVNVADNQGRRPLHLTVIDNEDTLDTTVLECLLEHDADPSLTDAIERMPLFYYTAFHGDDIPKQIGLLSRGCSNLNHKDIMGKPPLFAIVRYFIERRNIIEEEFDIMEFQKVISELVKAGVDINCQDIEGSTCLHLTVGRIGRGSSHLKLSDFTRVLLDAGADRNARDVDGNTPAHIAAEGEDADQLRVLASETWQDCPNLNGETVKDILCRKVTLAKERRKIGVDFEFTAETLHFVKDMMTDCRFGDVTVDIIETLDRKVPQAIRASGFTDTMIYPVPALLSILKKNVELTFTEVLEDLKEARVHTNCCRVGSTGCERLRTDCAALKPKQVDLLPLLWKTGHPCVLATRIKKLMWEFIQSKRQLSSSPLNMPPAPEAVTHIIRDILHACRDNAVGEFHFGDEQCAHERCEIGRQVRELVSDLADAVGQMDHRLQCKLILAGSVAEGTKLWKPDEFDFMMELTQLKGHSRLAYAGGIISSNTTVISLDDELKEMWREFLIDDCLSPEKLRDYLVLLTWRAGFSLQRQKYKNLSFNLSQQSRGTGNIHPLVRTSSVGVLLHVRWHGYEYPSLVIDVDLTPSVPFSDWPDLLSSDRSPQPAPAIFDTTVGYHAITVIKKDGAYWRLSFSLAELNIVRNRLSPVHRELYKGLKLLRDIHMREGGTPSHALKSIVFNYVFKENAGAPPEKPTGKTAAASAYPPECNLKGNYGDPSDEIRENIAAASTISPECDLSGNVEDHPYEISGNTAASNSPSSKFDDLARQGEDPLGEMARNMAGASSIAKECDGTRNRELTKHVRNVLRRLEQEQLQQRLPIKRDSKKFILSNFFTNDPLQDINTLDVSTDWCWLSILEFRKEGLY